MMLAELSGLEIAGVICGMAFGAGALLISIVAVNKKQEVRVEQPVNVTITEELHKVFASKETFETHVAENKREHDNFFAKLGGVERGAAANLAGRFDKISEELTGQGKDIAGLKKETEMQNQTLASVQSDIKLILGRLPRNTNELYS